MHYKCIIMSLLEQELKLLGDFKVTSKRGEYWQKSATLLYFNMHIIEWKYNENWYLKNTAGILKITLKLCMYILHYNTFM